MTRQHENVIKTGDTYKQSALGALSGRRDGCAGQCKLLCSRIQFQSSASWKLRKVYRGGGRDFPFYKK